MERIGNLAKKYCVGALGLGILGALIWHDPQMHNLGVWVSGFAVGIGFSGVIFGLASRQ